MLLLIKYTLLYGIVLMLVALGGMFSEHSGIINIALEGIMVIGGVAGVLTLTMLPADMSPFLVVLISVLVAALAGIVYSLLLAFASISQCRSVDAPRHPPGRGRACRAAGWGTPGTAPPVPRQGRGPAPSSSCRSWSLPLKWRARRRGHRR